MEKIKENESFLCTVASTRFKRSGKVLIKGAKSRQLDALCEIILNVLKGTITLPTAFVKKFKKHKAILRKLAKKCLKKLFRKKLLIKYFTIVRHIIAAALPICVALAPALL
jgi:hypothetical protein